jgi:uncharacterized protein (TIGR04255 family)
MVYLNDSKWWIITYNMSDMAISPVYKQPPITEAVIGVNFVNEVSESDLLNLKSKFSQHYPNYQLVENLSFKVELGVGDDNKKTANTDIAQEIGHRLSTANMTELLVILPKSIVVSQLAPYPGWDSFFKRFVRDWKLLKHAQGFQPIHRLGVRYINRIDIPCDTPIVEHEKYLNIYPNITGKYGPLTAYAVQAEVFMGDLECRLTINSAVVPSPILNHASFVIDQDIAREINVPQKDDDIFALIEKIRFRKNDVFESCVTNEARALFKHDN